MIRITTRECGWCHKKLGSAADATGHALECEEQPYAVFRKHLKRELQDTYTKMSRNGILPDWLSGAILAAERETEYYVRRQSWKFVQSEDPQEDDE